MKKNVASAHLARPLRRGALLAESEHARWLWRNSAHMYNDYRYPDNQITLVMSSGFEE